MVFKANGLSTIKGKAAKKILTGMSKTAPGCAFAVVAADGKGRVTLFASCGKECDEKLKSANVWTSAAFPDGKGGGKDDSFDLIVSIIFIAINEKPVITPNSRKNEFRIPSWS